MKRRMEAYKLTIVTDESEKMPTCSTQAGESILKGSIFVGEDKIACTDIDCGESVTVIQRMATATESHNVVAVGCKEDSDRVQSNANKSHVNEQSSEPERPICYFIDDDPEVHDPSAAEAMPSTQWVEILSSALSGSINMATMDTQSFVDAAVDDDGEAAVDACRASQYNPIEDKERSENEGLQCTSLPDLPRATEPPAEVFYLPNSNISTGSADANFTVNHENRLAGNSGENENFPTQVSEISNQIIQGTDEQDKYLEMMGSPTGLQSTPEISKYPHVEQEKDCTAVEPMPLRLESLRDPLFLQEGSEDSHNNAVALTSRVDAMENFICLQPTPDISYSDSDPVPENTNHVSVLQKSMDKHCSTTATMSTCKTSDQQSSAMIPGSCDSPITNGSESPECVDAFNLKINVANIDSWYAKESLKGLTYQDVQGIWQPPGAENSAGFSSSGSKEDQADTENSTSLKVRGGKELCTGSPVDAKTETATGNEEEDPATDFTDRGLVPTEDASENEAMYLSYMGNRLQATECFSCPLLYSWDDHSADELDFQQFATAEKKELELQRGSYDSDDSPKISLERKCSENVRRPLCNLFAEDSFSDCEARAPSTEQTESGPLVKSVQHAWTSPPARPTSREKHKGKSFFRYCICLPAVH